MNQNEDNFNALRQLLKLKQHETPPPGYFNGFSDQIISRIRAGEGGPANAAEGFFVQAPWLLKFLQLFELKPAFAGAFASALCLLLVFGIVYADRPDMAYTQPLLQNSEPGMTSFAALTPAAVPMAAETTGLVASTNPATSLQPVASLFDSQNPFAQQVSFTLSDK